MPYSLTSIGTHNAGSGTTGSITVPAGGVPAGACIVVGVVEQGTNTIGSGVTDTAGNTYTLIKPAVANGTNCVGAVYRCWNCKALVSGNTITYTAHNSSDSNAESACYITGVDNTADPLDSAVVNSATGSSAAPTITSGTPSQSGELMMGFLLWNALGTTFTQDSTHEPYSTFPVLVVNSTQEVGVAGGAWTNTGSGAITYAPAITSSPWVAFTAGFKAPAAAAVAAGFETTYELAKRRAQSRGLSWADDFPPLGNVASAPFNQAFDDQSPIRSFHPRPKGDWYDIAPPMPLPAVVSAPAESYDLTPQRLPHPLPKGEFTIPPVFQVPSPPHNQDFDDHSPMRLPHPRPRGTWTDDFPPRGNVPSGPHTQDFDDRSPPRVPHPRPRGTWVDDFPPQPLNTNAPPTLRQPFDVEPPQRMRRRLPAFIIFDVPGKFHGGTPVATRTMGTSSTTVLTAVQFAHPADGLTSASGNQIAPADIAAFNALAKWDPQGSVWPFSDFDPNTQLQPFFNCLSADGWLLIPGRGKLRVREGDFVAIDTQTGWPILVSAYAAAQNPSWVHS